MRKANNKKYRHTNKLYTLDQTKYSHRTIVSPSSFCIYVDFRPGFVQPNRFYINLCLNWGTKCFNGGFKMNISSVQQLIDRHLFIFQPVATAQLSKVIFIVCSFYSLSLYYYCLVFIVLIVAYLHARKISWIKW